MYVRGDWPHWFVPTTTGDRVLQDWPPSRLGRRPAGPPFPGAPPRRTHPPLPRPRPGPGAAPPAGVLVPPYQPLQPGLPPLSVCRLARRPGRASGAPVTDGPGGSRRWAAPGRLYLRGTYELTVGFTEVVDYLLHFDQAHVMAVTNALLVKNYAADLARWPRGTLSPPGEPGRPQENKTIITCGGRLAGLPWPTSPGPRPRAWPVPCPCALPGPIHPRPSLPVDLAGEVGAANFHLIWYFVRGRGAPEDFVAPEAIFPQVVEGPTAGAASLGRPAQPGHPQSPGFLSPGTITRRRRQRLGIFSCRGPGRPPVPISRPGGS